MKHETYIAGVKFRPGVPDYMAGLPADAEFDLEPEPTNEYDPNAVKVLNGGVHVGYVPRDLAPEIGDLIAQGRVERVVRRGNGGLDIHYSEDEAA